MKCSSSLSKSIRYGSFIVAACCLFAGCGGNDKGPKLVPVSGVVQLDGAPLPGVGVTFHPDTAKGNTSQYLPAAVADADGNYELIAAAEKGAAVGWYKVVLAAPVPPRTGGDAPKVGPPPFNVKYTSPATTDLNVEVKEGAASGSYDFNVTK